MTGESGPDSAGAFLAAIDQELSGLSRSGLRGPASALSARYRSAETSRGTGGFAPGELHAYLAIRLPATFAAAHRVLSELHSLRPDWAPTSVVDLGAGPGTATWAAAAVFPSLERAVLVEREPQMAELGARLAKSAPGPLMVEARWVVGDAADPSPSAAEADLIVGAYVLGELRADRQRPALERWWRATLGELVLIEPGTPAGFERLRTARSELISWGAHVTAPCPHDRPCPMKGPDWCHFAVRLPRSALHRDVKGARLGYEDEKYAYLAVSPNRATVPVARLVRSPRPHKGHVRLWLCESGGLEERVVSRRDGELYRRARAARWGDRLDLGHGSS